MAGPFVTVIGRGVIIWLVISHPDIAIRDNVVRHDLVVEKITVTPTHDIHTEAR